MGKPSEKFSKSVKISKELLHYYYLHKMRQYTLLAVLNTTAQSKKKKRKIQINIVLGYTEPSCRVIALQYNYKLISYPNYRIRS